MKNPAKSLPDTNILIRYLTRDVESLYARAKDFFDKVKEGSAKAIILESVIAESIYVLTKIYKVPKNRAAESLIDILCIKAAGPEKALFSFDSDLNKISDSRLQSAPGPQKRG
jgi:hypothetical protein